MIANTLPVILFLSANNASRTQIAEALFRNYAGDRFAVYSAGLEAGDFSPYAMRVLDEVGVRYDEQTAKDVKQYLGKLDVRFLVTISHQAAEQGPTVFPGALYYFHWDLTDPEIGGGNDVQTMQRFRTVRDQIDTYIKQWLSDFEQGLTNSTRRRTQEIRAIQAKE
jgi:arsenate reductase (thioredoxin)